MSTFASIKAQLQELIDSANVKTGRTDADLTSAVGALVGGYGSGGGGSVPAVGSDSPSGNLLSNFLYALTRGEVVTGEFTLTAPLPNTETLIFDSGVAAPNGITIFNVDFDFVKNTKYQFTAFTMIGLYGRSVAEYDYSANKSSSFGTFITISTQLNKYTSNADTFTTSQYLLLYASLVRFDNGKLYCTAEHNLNASYSPFMPNNRYMWVVW